MFWRSLMQALGTKLNKSTAYAAQKDGQTEQVNRTLGEILHAYFAENCSPTGITG
jgi:ABC-type phosphate transport system auxiliary subunit